MNKVSLLSLTLALLAPTALVACDADTTAATAEQGAALTSKPSFQIFQDDAWQFRFNLRAANNKVILVSEGYQTRAGALGGVASVLANGENAANFEINASADGGAYFNLFAQNGEIIGTSEVYASKANARAGVTAVGQAIAAHKKAINEQAAGFERFVGKDGQFYFRLRAANGEIVLQSEGYVSEAGALNGAFSVAENGKYDFLYDIKAAVNGQFFFTIVAWNGEIVAKSELYASKSNAERARDAVIALLATVQPL